MEMERIWSCSLRKGVVTRKQKAKGKIVDRGRSEECPAQKVACEKTDRKVHCTALQLEEKL